MDYTINLGVEPSVAIAEEVISSAVRILIIAGLSQSEIATFFSRTAETLAGNSDLDSDDSDEVKYSDIDHFLQAEDDKMYNIQMEFDELPCNKKLERLEKRSEIITDLEDTLKFDKAWKIIAEAVPLRLEAMAWLKRRGNEFGLEVHIKKSEWIETANDEDLDKESMHIFLDDYKWRQSYGWRLVESLVDKLASVGATDSINSIYEVISSDELYLDSFTIDRVERAKKSAALFKEFKNYIREFSGGAEQMQSQIVDAFQRINNSEPIMYVDAWLERLAADGVLDRYKRSNRWRLLVH
jgi:hypothetical protein